MKIWKLVIVLLVMAAVICSTTCRGRGGKGGKRTPKRPRSSLISKGTTHSAPSGSGKSLKVPSGTTKKKFMKKAAVLALETAMGGVATGAFIALISELLDDDDYNAALEQHMAANDGKVTAEFIQALLEDYTEDNGGQGMQFYVLILGIPGGSIIFMILIYFHLRKKMRKSVRAEIHEMTSK